MLRKLTTIAAVTTVLTLGSAGTALADTPPPVFIPQNGCATNWAQCLVEGFVSNLMTGSADSGSAS